MKIEFRNVSKEYKRGVFGVHNINLTIENGVFGLLGRNGAGKTTLLRLLATILKPTEGQILFNDMDLKTNSEELRSHLGYLPQNSRLQPSLTAYEYLDYMAIIKNIKNKQERKKEVERCLEVVGLNDQKKKKLGAFSGGMLRRAGIAQAMLGNPELIIVDEPTTGLDPEERLYFRNFLSKIAVDRSIILSTHIISDIENICKNVGVMEEGSLLYNGPVDDLVRSVESKVWECNAPAEKENEIKENATVTAVSYGEKDSKIRYISENSVYDSSVKKDATLEDAYIYTVGGIKR
ncbi:MAG TPA: ABC transporter ATP-binding protein [Ruminiclostridium sp.]|nr:ABC transporter ATP-binding protein [Ruminiclostridium sp.]